MVSKILYKSHKLKNQKGLTILEVTIAIALILILMSAVLVMVNPIAQIKKARDNRRMSDLSFIDRAITEYKVDKGSYPDTANTLRISNVLPSGSSSLNKAASGWIKQNLSSYMSHLPTDPTNDDTYNYKYIHNNDTYEISAKLEYYFEDAQNDGGNDAQSYEIGNDLTLISP